MQGQAGRAGQNCEAERSDTAAVFAHRDADVVFGVRDRDDGAIQANAGKASALPVMLPDEASAIGRGGGGESGLAGGAGSGGGGGAGWSDESGDGFGSGSGVCGGDDG